jgi:hypothetical protein
MRNTTIAIALSTALVAGGCGTDGPVHAPSPVATRPIIPAEVWDLTIALTTVSGPACLTEEQMMGLPTEWRLQILRQGTGITLLYGFSGDTVEMRGSTDGDAFTASTSVSSGTIACEEAMVAYELEVRVAGRFSADGRTLTALETSTYRLQTNETYVMVYEWSAVRL